MDSAARLTAGMRELSEPAGACDACGRCCYELNQIGTRCHYCQSGLFWGRHWWVFWRDDALQWLATPREDIDPAELATARRWKE